MGTTVKLLIFLTLVTIVAAKHWTTWSPWSDCSRTCDGGATYQTRRCIKIKYFRYRCRGRSIRYSTCNNNPCPSGLPDFRAEQCAAYNDASYSGYFFRWLPYHNAENPCALSCIAEGTKMVAVLAPKVLDGTRCSTYSMDMCINGVCMDVGCDNVLESQRKLDSCGVCGGNNTCKVSDRAGQYRWIQTDYGPCSVTCGVGVQEKRLLCFETVRGKVMDAVYCDNIIKPSDSTKECNIGPCPPEWRVGPWQNCTRDCGGGVSWRIVTCVRTHEDGTQLLVRDSECSNLRPSSRKSCNGFICPTWHAGEWSVCSASCGTGTQMREVVCRHIGDTYCLESDKPRLVKNCTTGIPCYNVNDFLYVNGRRITGDIQERNVEQFMAGSSDVMGMPQGDEAAVTKYDLLRPRFVTTTWDTCSTTCGKGIKFRYVRCQVFLKYLDDFADLPDEDCLANEVKPAEYDSCMVEPCYHDYEWQQAGITECSKTCLGGIQETILNCVHKETKEVVTDDFCVEAPHVQTERWICNDKPCPQRWELGEFGGCSTTCGLGIMSRTVKCIREYAQGPNILTLPDFMCPQPVPDRESPCNTQKCPAHWTVGNWSECSVTCGVGIMVRHPTCQREHNETLVTVAINECDFELKPETEKTCNMTPCPEPTIKKVDLEFYQLNKIKKIRLVVGMKAFVLPETNIIIKCPHVGLDRQKITWFKNGLRFRRSKRARMARSGALRIRNARPGTDEGVYSCFVGGLEANISIHFSTSFSVLQDTVTRDKFIRSGGLHEANLMNGSYSFMDPIKRQLRPLVLRSSDWSRCSMTCGGGLQSRNFSCEVITNDYYEVLSKSECFQHLDVPPLAIQSCNIDPCVTWRTGNWSECSSGGCVRHQYSIQRRTVQCVNEFNDSITDEKYCRELGFPPDSARDCVNMNCTEEWRTSKWSDCYAEECGQKGLKTRMLECVWMADGKPAPPGGCDHMTKPRTSRNCQGPPCEENGTEENTKCTDESDYCSIVRMMNMCNMIDYKKRCCWTCDDDYYYYDYEETGDESPDVDDASIS